MDTIVHFWKANETVLNIIAWLVGVGAVAIPLLIFHIRWVYYWFIQQERPAWLKHPHPPALPKKLTARRTWPNPFQQMMNDRIYLIGTNVGANPVGFLAKLNLDAGQSATFYDLYGIAPVVTFHQDRHSAAWNQWVSQVAHEIPYPNPGIPAPDAEAWIQYGREAAREMGVKLEPKGFRRSVGQRRA